MLNILMISNKPMVKKNSVKNLLIDMSQSKIKQILEMEEMEEKDQKDIYNCFSILDSLEGLSWKDAQRRLANKGD